MVDQVIGATLKVDATSAAAASKTTAELKQNVKDLKVAFDNTKVGSTEQAAAFKKLQSAQDDLTKSTSSLGKATEEGGGHFANIREQAAALPGPLGAAGEGANNLNSQFLKLLANPVGLVLVAIVAALALLYKSFTNTMEGGEKVEQVFAGIKAIVQALVDNIGNFAGALVKLMKFDFSGAVNDIKGIVNSAGAAYSKMADLTKQSQALAKEQAQNDLEQAQRQAKLADLRAKAYDESVPIAKRKAALIELQKESEVNAKEDMDLAKRVADNAVAQLEVEEDGANKNQIKIKKIRADELRNATENSNELKQIGKQVTVATKQELAEQKAAAAKAAEEAKKARQELIDFTNKLAKIQQDTELAAITDTYEKEKKQLENKIADDKRTNDLAFQDKKITRAQYAAINQALDKQADAQRATLTDKHNADVATKEAAFQKDLAGIIAKIKEGEEVDARAVERIKLEADHAQRLADAAKNYKDDAAKLQTIRAALTQQYHADQQKLEAKFKKEDDEAKIQKDKAIIADTKSDLKIKKAAFDDQQAILRAAFDQKLITEKEYNAGVQELSQERMKIDEIETNNKKNTFALISQGLGMLSDALGKATLAGKIAAIAQTTIDTYSAAWTIFRQAALNPISIPFPAYPYIQAGLAIAGGLLNVQKIVSVQTPGGGGGSAPSGGAPAAPSTPAAPVAPTQISTTFNPKDNPTSGTASANRTYVVDTDIQNAADRNARLARAARLGGR